MKILGDVAGLVAILLDDMVDTAGTLIRAAEALTAKGAQAVHACCIHPVLSGQAVKNIENSPIEKLIVTDTIPLSAEAAACSKIKVVSIAHLLAQAIEKIHNDDSVSSLFN
jgi:ribose-phosphate pyrophosphokinase